MRCRGWRWAAVATDSREALRAGTWVSPRLTAPTQMGAPTTTPAPGPARGCCRAKAAAAGLLLWVCPNGKAVCGQSGHLCHGNRVGKGHGCRQGLGEVPRAGGHRLSENSTATNSQVPTESRTGKLDLKRSICIISSREDASTHGLSSKNVTICKLMTSSAHVSDYVQSTK